MLQKTGTQLNLQPIGILSTPPHGPSQFKESLDLFQIQINQLQSSLVEEFKQEPILKQDQPATRESAGQLIQKKGAQSSRHSSL